MADKTVSKETSGVAPAPKAQGGMYKQFQTDGSLETRGITLDYGDFRVTIARAGGANKRFARVLEAKTKPYRRAIDAELIDNDRANEMLLEVYADTIVLDWEVKVGDEWKKGIEAPYGETIPFTQENVCQTFRNLPDLFFDIQSQANKVALFRQAELEDEGKN